MITIKEAQQALENADQLYTPSQIDKTLDRLADKINSYYQTQQLKQPVIVISIMNGGLIPAGHLLTRFDFPLFMDFIHATRYRNQTSGGELDWKVEPHLSLARQRILLVDDILDEGYTLDAIAHYCEEQGAEEVKSVVLVEKEHDRRKPGVNCDFIGIQVEDRYVFGFGMDYRGYHRNLDGIYALNES